MLIFRFIITTILLIISVPLYFVKIIGDTLSSLFEYFYDRIDDLARELSVYNLAKRISDENKELKKKIKSLENEKLERTKNGRSNH